MFLILARASVREVIHSAPFYILLHSTSVLREWHKISLSHHDGKISQTFGHPGPVCDVEAKFHLSSSNGRGIDPSASETDLLDSLASVVFVTQRCIADQAVFRE
jgi:hypothetical protein